MGIWFTIGTIGHGLIRYSWYPTLLDLQWTVPCAISIEKGCQSVYLFQASGRPATRILHFVPDSFHLKTIWMKLVRDVAGDLVGTRAVVGRSSFTPRHRKLTTVLGIMYRSMERSLTNEEIDGIMKPGPRTLWACQTHRCHWWLWWRLHGLHSFRSTVCKLFQLTFSIVLIFRNSFHRSCMLQLPFVHFYMVSKSHNNSNDNNTHMLRLSLFICSERWCFDSSSLHFSRSVSPDSVCVIHPR
jgi:hypothetical protein